MKDDNIPLLIPYQPDVYWQEVRKIVREEITNALKNRKTPNEQLAVNGLTERPLYKITDLCALFNITRTTVHEWVKMGKLNKIKVGSRVYFLAADVRKLFEVSTEA